MGGVVDLKPFLECRVPFLSLVLSQIMIYYADEGPTHSFGAATTPSRSSSSYPTIRLPGVPG